MLSGVMLAKFCNAPGCRNTCEVGQKYCAKHQAAADAHMAKLRQKYDTEIRRGRDKQYTDLYHSFQWERKRLYIIAKYFGLDVYVYYTKHQVVPATTVHHIEPLRESWKKRLDDSNLIPLSAESHAEIEKIYLTSGKEELQRRLRRMLANWEAEHTQGG